MGKPVARVGDSVINKNDHHPFSAPVPVVGVITQGSLDTFHDGRPAAICNPLKLGTHAACLFTNTFYCKTGSDKMFVNDFPQARSGDATSHCGSADQGGLGTLGEIQPLCSLVVYA